MTEAVIHYSDIKTVPVWPEGNVELTPELRQAIQKALAESLDRQFLVMCGGPPPAPTTYRPFGWGRGAINMDGVT